MHDCSDLASMSSRSSSSHSSLERSTEMSVIGTYRKLFWEDC